MTLIDPIDRYRLEPRLRELLDELPDLPHFALLAHAETAFEPRLAYGRVLMHDLALDRRTAEMVILAVAGWAGCDYIAAQHREQATRLGIPAADVRAALALDPAGLADPELRAAVGFVAEMLADHAASPERLQALVGLVGERGLIETGLVVERYLGLSLLLNSLQVPPVAAVALRDVEVGPHR